MTGWVTMALLTVGPFAGGPWPQSSPPLDRLLKDAQQTKGKILRCGVPGRDTPSSLTDLSAEHTLPATFYCTHKKTTYSKSEPLAWDSTARVRGLYPRLSGGPQAPHHNHLTTAHQYP